MTATEELRRLLDELGVKWTNPNSCLRDEMTNWVANGFDYEAFEVPEFDGTFLLTAAHQDDLTPEQAIAATLGAGECTLESIHGYCDPYVRTAYQIELSCHTLDAWDDPIPPSYCPYCGKRVVKEDA